jgi:hypothetical protein
MVKVTLADRRRVQLWPENHAEWAEDIRKEALLIKADEILAEKYAAPPEGLSDVDEALWHERSSALFLRILHSLSHKVLLARSTRNRQHSFGTSRKQNLACPWPRSGQR